MHKESWVINIIVKKERIYTPPSPTRFKNTVIEANKMENTLHRTDVKQVTILRLKYLLHTKTSVRLSQVVKRQTIVSYFI